MRCTSHHLNMFAQYSAVFPPPVPSATRVPSVLPQHPRPRSCVHRMVRPRSSSLHRRLGTVPSRRPATGCAATRPSSALPAPLTRQWTSPLWDCRSRKDDLRATQAFFADGRQKNGPAACDKQFVAERGAAKLAPTRAASTVEHVRASGVLGWAADCGADAQTPGASPAEEQVRRNKKENSEHAACRAEPCVLQLDRYVFALVLTWLPQHELQAPGSCCQLWWGTVASLSASGKAAFPQKRAVCGLCCRPRGIHRSSTARCRTCHESAKAQCTPRFLLGITHQSVLRDRFGSPEVVEGTYGDVRWKYTSLGFAATCRLGSLLTYEFFEGYGHSVCAGVALGGPAFETDGQHIWNVSYGAVPALLLTFTYSDVPRNFSGLRYRALILVTLHVRGLGLTAEEEAAPWDHSCSVGEKLQRWQYRCLPS